MQRNKIQLIVACGMSVDGVIIGAKAEYMYVYHQRSFSND